MRGEIAMSQSSALSARAYPFRSSARAKRIYSQITKTADHLATKVIIFILTLSVCAGFCVWVKLSILRISYDLSSKREVYQKELAEQKKLSIEAASLASPKRLAVIAEEKLGLSSPTEHQIIYIKK